MDVFLYVILTVCFGFLIYIIDSLQGRVENFEKRIASLESRMEELAPWLRP